jgi:hypothetical protein
MHERRRSGLRVAGGGGETAGMQSGCAMRRRLIAPAVLLMALAAGAVSWGQPGSGEPLGARRHAQPLQAAEAFDYFPARYVNQATETGQHIQAF